ncbi:MAG: trk system potassium uptake protein TrkA [Bradymonadia bacterium]
MRILIVGAGEVGFNIASRLVTEGHDVMIVDRDEARLERATSNLDVQGLRGHGARPGVLEEAGIDKADMLVAVTNTDEVNMVACLVASILGKSDIIKIARVRDPSYLDERIFSDERVQIDLAINPERECADKISAMLRFDAVTEVVDFDVARVQLVGFKIADTSPLAGMRFIDLRDRFGARVLVAALHRGTQVIVPSGTDVILPGDEAYLVVPYGQGDTLLSTVGVKRTPVTRVMIAGGSKIGRFIAEDLVKRGVIPILIEPDPKLARWLGDQLEGVVVLHGSPTDTALLQSSHAAEMQAFIAASHDEEVNIMAALLAQRLGCRRVVAVVNSVDYQPLAKAIGVDVCVSPRLTAVSSILHFIRKGRVVASRALGAQQSAEALEFEAQLTSEAVGYPLNAIKWPRESIVACIQRGDEAIIPTGETVIQEGDHVLVVATQSAIPAVECLLARRQDQR